MAASGLTEGLEGAGTLAELRARLRAENLTYFARAVAQVLAG